MKRILIFLVLAGLASCERLDHSIEGEWQVKNTFYQARYKVMRQDHGWSALILHYDDGTSRFSHSPESPRLLFTDLRAEGDTYVDGVSGATKKKDDLTFRLRAQGQDTLLVAQFILGKNSEEIWTRVKTKQ